MMKTLLRSVLIGTLLFGSYTVSQAEAAVTPVPVVTTTPTSTPTPTLYPNYGTYQSGNYTYQVLDVAATQVSITKISNAAGDIVIPSQINGLKVVQIGNKNDREGVYEDWGMIVSATDRSKVSSIIVPEGVTKIGTCAFYNMVNLKTVKLPNSLKAIDERGFGGCAALTDIVFGDNALSIGISAFSGCSALTNLNFKNVVDINENAFEDCQSLVNVSFSNKETWVDLSVFEGCDKLTRLVFPKSMKEIQLYGGAFGDNTTLIVQGLNTEIVAEDIKSIDNMTIIAAKHAKANRFAKRNNITYIEVSLPNAPVISKVKTVAGKKQIRWKKVSSASGYKVYYSKTKSGSFKKLMTTSKTSYTITKKGYFKIRAYKKYADINWYGSYTTKKVS